MLDKIKQLRDEIANFQATTLDEVEQFRIKHLSKKGSIAALFDDFKSVPVEQKKAVGQELNVLKNTALEKVNELKEMLSNAEEGLSGLDMTMPGDPMKLGTRHPLSIVKNEIISIFNRLGFTVSEGPEIEDDWHNFSALNFPEDIRLAICRTRSSSRRTLIWYSTRTPHPCRFATWKHTSLPFVLLPQDGYSVTRLSRLGHTVFSTRSRHFISTKMFLSPT